MVAERHRVSLSKMVACEEFPYHPLPDDSATSLSVDIPSAAASRGIAATDASVIEDLAN